MNEMTIPSKRYVCKKCGGKTWSPSEICGLCNLKILRKIYRGSVSCSQSGFCKMEKARGDVVKREAELMNHAEVKVGGYTVPLIGIPKDAMLQECDLCHKDFPMREIELSEIGQALCEKCRKK